MSILDDPDRIAVNYETAAKAVGVSEDTVRRWVRQKRLVPRYPTAKPVLLVSELRQFVESAPCESPVEYRRR